MNEAQTTTQKIKVTVHLQKEAYDLMYDFGYASARTMGDFISETIVEHHRRLRLAREKPLTKAELAAELRTLADALEKAK